MSRCATVFEPPIRAGGNRSADVPDHPGYISTVDTPDECRTIVQQAIEIPIEREVGYVSFAPPPAVGALV